VKEQNIPIFTKTTEITNLGWVNKKPNAEYLFYFHHYSYSSKRLTEKLIDFQATYRTAYPTNNETK
jgi:hypothetical protein